MSLTSDFIVAGITALGSEVFFFFLVCIIFVVLLFITRQSITSAILLGMVFFDGLVKVFPDNTFILFSLGLKILILAIVGYGVAKRVVE